MAKAYFFCEHCGKRYETEKDALACEALHIEEQARRAKLAQERQARIDEISADVKAVLCKIEAFNKDYDEAAPVPYFNTIDKLFSTLNRLF